MYQIIILVLLHIIADFFLQGTKLSQRKRLQLPALFEHVGIYLLTFVAFSAVTLSISFVNSILFSLLNAVLHLAVDYVTGKLKSTYWKVNESRYLSIVAIDQTLHIVILISTFMAMFQGVK